MPLLPIACLCLSSCSCVRILYSTGGDETLGLVPLVINAGAEYLKSQKNHQITKSPVHKYSYMGVYICICDRIAIAKSWYAVS